jgi:hypothetical protein
MKVVNSWKWGRIIIPEEERRARRNVAKVQDIYPLNIIDFNSFCKESTVLLTGDGECLQEDVKRFESWNVPHDLFCCNRSILYFQRPVQHWGAVDAEESAWLSEFYNPAHGRFLRHVIGACKVGYDIFWAINTPCETEFGRRLWIGNSGYFGMLCCLAMGYKKVVLAGMPLDRNRHWYDPEGVEGPNWASDTYTIWMDYKMQKREAERVRSLSGYSKFIMGEATKEWAS